MRICLTILLLTVFLLPSALDAQPGRTISESMNFAPVSVGALKEMELRVTGLQGIGGFVVRDSCIDPFTMRTQLQDLRIKNGEVRIKVEFNPLLPGDFRDEIILERRPALTPKNDVIRIRLFGTAFRVIRDERIEFGQVLTGDSSRRIVFVRANLDENVRWEILGKITPPFELLTLNGPIPVGGDTLAFAFSFQPTSSGRFLDTIKIVRVFRLGPNVPLDTMRVHYVGEGVRMPSEKTVSFTNMNIGIIKKDTVTIELPTKKISVPFSYTIAPRQRAGSVTARLLSPVGPSNESKIVVELTCAPTTLDSSRYGFALLRSAKDSEPIDSTIIIANVVVAPRPVKLSVRFLIDTLLKRIGDTVDVDIVAETTDPIDRPLSIRTWICDVTYNPSMVVPLLQAGQTVSVVDDRPILALDRQGANGMFVFSTSPQVIGTFRFVVTLGDASFTPVAMMQLGYIDEAGTTQTNSPDTNTIVVTNVWRYQDGAQRLVNPFLGTLVADVDPNPVITQSTLSIRNVAAQVGRLTVIDGIGQIRADLTAQLRTGKREFSISSGGSSDVSLTPGTYYARLIVEGASGNTINSVVRVFVVQ